MAKNVHNVPKKQWNKWNRIEQAAFNRTWSYLTPVILPTHVKMNRRDFSVLRYNICWEVAAMFKEWRGFWIG